MFVSCCICVTRSLEYMPGRVVTGLNVCKFIILLDVLLSVESVLIYTPISNV